MGNQVHRLSLAAVCVAGLVILLVGVGCKKSVKGEESRWSAANKEADEVAALYPGFKPAVTERKTAAKKLYDAAQGIDDEDKKISKLSEANRLLTTGFIPELAKIDDEIKKMRGGIIDAKGAKVEGADKARADEAIAQVKKALDEVDAMLTKGAPNAVAADAVLKRANKDLDHARTHLAKVGPAPAAATAKPAADQPAEAAEWVCEYCDTRNVHDAETCKNCGAAKPADPKAKPGAAK